MFEPDSAWVINLPRRTDRLKSFKVGARNLNFEVDVHAAVDGEQIDKPDSWSASSGALACALSHAEVLRKSCGLTLVFEDDAVVPANFHHQIELMLAELPSDWEMLALGYSVHSKPLPFSGHLLQPVRFQLTHAYLLRDNRAIEVVCEIAERARTHWDTPLGRAMSHRGRTYLANPILVKQSGLASDIPDSSANGRPGSEWGFM